jgi:heat shock factor-binding protein 1
MSTSIIGRIDEMGNRIDDLEKSISDLMEQAGIDAQAPPAEDDETH